MAALTLPLVRNFPEIQMSSRQSRTLGALIFLALASACGESGERDYTGMPEFCQEVLPRVDAFLAGFEHPVGDRYGGTAAVGAIGEIPGGMNALITSDHGASQHQLFVNLMTLVRFDEEYEPAPWLAESWELNEENTEITFHLRDDVFWHDGERTTAHDVEFTYLRATDPETAFPNAAFWESYVRGPEGVEVVDSFTVRVRLEPHAELLDPWRAVAIMPRHLLEDVPPAELRDHPIGTRCPVGNGPFVFDEHQPDAYWSFTRNPAFPEGLGGPPFLQRYVYRVIPEQTTLLTELLTGGVDVYVAAAPDQAPRIMDAENIELISFPFRQYVFVGWNTRRPQLADARVRRAIAFGTNREEIVEALLGGYGQVANAGVPPMHWAYSVEIRDSLRYDPAEAQRLLDEAGWIDRDGDGVRENDAGLRLEFSIKYNRGNQQRQDIAEIMQSQLREVGIAARPEVLEWTTLQAQITDVENRDFDGVVMGWITEFKVDDRDLHHSSAAETPYGWSGTNDPRLDRLLDTLQLVVDRDDARPLWHEFQNELVRLQPYTYFYFTDRIVGASHRIENLTMDVRGEWVSLKEWWIPAEHRRAGER